MAADADFYLLETQLDPAGRALLDRVRDFM